MSRFCGEESLCAVYHLLFPYIAGVVRATGTVLQRVHLSPLLPLLKHARASIRQKVELLHHHVLWNADLLPQVQTLCHDTTDKQRRLDN